MEFVRAVREAMPSLRYRKARIGGVPVRQLLQQRFHFRIKR